MTTNIHVNLADVEKLKLGSVGFLDGIHIPIGSMRLVCFISLLFYHQDLLKVLNVGRYTIHGSHGI